MRQVTYADKAGQAPPLRLEPRRRLTAEHVRSQKRGPDLRGWVVVVALLLAGAGASAQTEAPAAGRILQRLYGLSVFPDSALSPRSYTISGTINQGGLNGVGVTNFDRQRGYVVAVDFGTLQTAQGITPSATWEVNPNGIVSDIDRLNNAALLVSRILESREYLSAPDSEFTRQYLGAVSYAGKGAFRFVFSVVHDSGLVVSFDAYIDSINGQVLGAHFEYDFISADLALSDYRDVGGYPFAFHSELTSSLPEMNSESQVTACAVNRPIDADIFIRPQTSSDAVSFPPETDSVSVSLEYKEGHLYFPARVNGSKRVLLLLDSGAGGIIIDKKQTGSFGLVLRGQQPGLGVAGSTAVSLAKLPAIDIAGIGLANQIVHVVDFGPGLRNAFPGVVGVIGFDLLARLPVTVDYQHQLLTIYNPATYQLPDSSRIRAVLPLEYYSNLPLVGVSVNGSAGKFVVDAGSGYGPLLHQRFIREYLLDSLPEREPSAGDGGYIGGVGGVLQTKPVTIADFGVGRAHFADQPAWLILGGGGFTDSKIIAGNLGNGFLDKFVVTFDYPHNRLILSDIGTE